MDEIIEAVEVSRQFVDIDTGEIKPVLDRLYKKGVLAKANKNGKRGYGRGTVAVVSAEDQIVELTSQLLETKIAQVITDVYQDLQKTFDEATLMLMMPVFAGLVGFRGVEEGNPAYEKDDYVTNYQTSLKNISPDIARVLVEQFTDHHLLVELGMGYLYRHRSLRLRAGQSA